MSDNFAYFRAMKACDQLTAILFIAAAYCGALSVMLRGRGGLWWPYAFAGCLPCMAGALLMVCRFYMEKNEIWAMRLMRKTSLGILIASLIAGGATTILELLQSFIVIVLSLLFGTSLLSAILFANLGKAIHTMISLPSASSGFEPVLRSDSDVER
jgi:hypothetical protein